MAVALNLTEIPIGGVTLESQDERALLREEVRQAAEHLSRAQGLLGGAPRPTLKAVKPEKKKKFPHIADEDLPSDFPLRIVRDYEIEPEWVDAQVVAVAAAGIGVEDLDEPEHIRVPPDLVPGKKEVFIRALGDSMIDAGIESGDLLIVELRRGGVAAHNEAVIGWLVAPGQPGGLVVKRWYRRGGKKMLVSENKDVPPIELTPEHKWELQAIVRRRYRPQRPEVKDFKKISG